MTTIGPLDNVSSSDKLTITFSYASLLPEFFLSEDDVRSAITALGHNVLSVDVTTLIGFRKIVVSLEPATAGQAGVIGKACADAIRESFVSVWDVAAEKYQLGSGEPIFTTQTTISLASLALLAVVGVGGFLYLTKGK